MYRVTQTKTVVPLLVVLNVSFFGSPFICIKKDIKKLHKAAFSLPKQQNRPLAKGRSPPQELEVGPHSGPYLLG